MVTWVQFPLDKGEPFSIGRWLDATTLALALAGPMVLLLSAFGVLAAKPREAAALPYRREPDNTAMVRRTYDLPENIALRLDLEAARKRTSKEQLLRDILDRALPPA